MSGTNSLSTKKGSLHICVDYNKPNSFTHRGSYLIPWTDNCIDSLKKAVVIFTLDTNSRYWQVEVEEKDTVKTAFTSYHGLYRFVRKPIGLKKNADI